jgi:chorismate synthase
MTAGESHGPALTVILQGLPAGLPLAPGDIDRQLARRQRGLGAGPRMKLEQDEARILGGVMAGQTTGAPLAILIENRDHVRWRGREIDPMTAPRPGHADLGGAVKYAYPDLRPALERASARETAARVAAGAACKRFLAAFGVQVGGYVTAIGEVTADVESIPPADRLALAEQSDVCCPDAAAAARMRRRIQRATRARDTLGGVLEVAALGLPAGLGSFAQWDRRLEARLGAAALSIQAIKGVEIGRAFETARLPGTQAQDAIRLEADRLARPTNRAGGIEGGISNGQPVVVRAAMKPIATTLTPQATVDLAAGEEVQSRYERSDFCPVPRAVPVLEAMVAFVLADALAEKLGGDSMTEMLARFASLRGPVLADLRMEALPRMWWPE